ncbi:MAG: vitamin K epoxide reductase family protein [Actinobacteria bacterium]|nr:vitamin K epoxide reductase family protein [Actinomycetota bacterium]
MFRESTKDARDLSDYLRTGSDSFVRGRRRTTALYLAGTAAFGVVTLYQMGLIKRVPEPRLPFLDADRVDASGEAYASLDMPDAILGMLSYAVTLMFVASGGKERATLRPWLPIAAAAKVLVDVASGGILTAEQAVKHRAFCSWCVGAAAVPVLSLPAVLPEALAALRSMTGTSRANG